MTSDRAVKSIPGVPHKPLAKCELYPTQNGLPDWKRLLDFFQLEGKLAIDDAHKIISDCTNIMKQEPNLLKLTDPITVVGDIHGQFFDFAKLLSVSGNPPDTQFVFLGDYVDRGSYSIEVLLTIYAMKIAYPKTVWMLRGNHECRQMTSFFNFRDECEYKYDMGVYDAFMDSFDALPIAATINGKFFCCHGGLSPELKTLAQLDSLNRFQEPPKNGLLCDLFWADPVDEEKKSNDTPLKEQGYTTNNVRGCSVKFNFDATLAFLERNKLLSVVRGHEAQPEGYKMHKVNPKNGFPTVITVFSAPNYCDVYKNKAAVIQFKDNTLSIVQFKSSPHPYFLPNFMDVFEWSIPFMIEKVSDIVFRILESSDKAEVDYPAIVKLGMMKSMHGKLNAQNLTKEQVAVVELAFKLSKGVLKKNDKSVSEEARSPAVTGEHQLKVDERAPSRTSEDPISSTRTATDSQASTSPSNATADPNSPLSLKGANRLRHKVTMFSRMSRILKTLREQNETIIKLKDCCPGHRLKPGLLLGGKQALVDELQAFEHATKLDAENERRPE